MTIARRPLSRGATVMAAPIQECSPRKGTLAWSFEAVITNWWITENMPWWYQWKWFSVYREAQNDVNIGSDLICWCHQLLTTITKASQRVLRDFGLNTVCVINDHDCDHDNDDNDDKSVTTVTKVCQRVPWDSSTSKSHPTLCSSEWNPWWWWWWWWWWHFPLKLEATLANLNQTPVKDLDL